MKKITLLLILILALISCQNQSVDKAIDKQPESQLSTSSDEVIEGCTKDLKICDDGQSVGRNKDNHCRFFECPAAIQGCTEDVKQCPDGSFVDREVTNDCEFKDCPSKNKGKNQAMLCTQEVKECSDGSFVGRDSYDDCAFKACPEGTELIKQDTK